MQDIAVDQRYRATLACEPVERPPLVVRPPFAARLQLPAPWDAFAVDPHRQAYRDPVAMMQMLLEDDHSLLMNEDRICALTVARRVPFINHRPPREGQFNGHARRRFPTGVVFTYEPRDFDDAREVVRTFRKT
jgi:hypothetical protein